MNTKNTTKVYRLGHTLFHQVESPVSISADSVRDGYDLTSESGRVIHIDNVLRGRTSTGRLLLVAPSPTTVKHPEHGDAQLDATHNYLHRVIWNRTGGYPDIRYAV